MAPDSGFVSEPTGRKDGYELAVVAAVLLLLTFATYGSFAPADTVSPGTASSLFTVAGLVEAQALTVVAKSGDFTLWTQGTTTFAHGTWSGNDHLVGMNTQPGAWVEFEAPPLEGRWRVIGYFTRAPDYGVVSISLNGRPLGGSLDLFAAEVLSTGPVDLGTAVFQPGRNVLRLAITGRNPANVPPHYQFGLDGFVFQPPADNPP